MPAEPPTTLLTSALTYARQAWHILPLHSVQQGLCTCGAFDCKSPGKHPHTEHGVNDATTDLDVITHWWEKWPNANIGAATGSIAGVAVVDIDPRDDGFKSLAKFDFPDTLTVQTGGGGLHLYFKAEGIVKSRKIAQGIEVKGDGGYVVVPPSNHLLGAYSWVNPLTQIASFPELSILAPPEPEPSQNGLVVHPDEKEWVVNLLGTPCPEGCRNIVLTKLAGYFRNLLPERVTRSLLETWNEQQCKPPLTLTELYKNIRHKYVRYTLPHDDTGFWTARSLLSQDFPEMVWVIEEILPEGLTVLAGRPKRGKSILSLQLAVAIATGAPALDRETMPGKVIYLALEDSPRRLKSKLERIGAGGIDDLMIQTEFPPLDKGGILRLSELIQEHKPILVIIDTMHRVLSRNTNQDKNTEMTSLLDPIQHLALDNHMSIILIVHHKKPGIETADAVDDIMGSTATAGVADGVWGLYRKLNERNAILRIAGRDLEPQELALVFDPLRYRWRCEGEAEAHQLAKRIRLMMILFEQHQWVDSRLVSQYLEIPMRAAMEVLNEARMQGLLDLIPLQNGKKGRPRYVYTRAKKE